MRDVFTPNLGAEYTGPFERMFDRFAICVAGIRMRASGLLLRYFINGRQQSEDATATIA